MAETETVAATIAAILVAHGKGTPEDVREAIRVYRACLRELKPPTSEPHHTPETPKQDEFLE
jgi:hypothetical protein